MATRRIAGTHSVLIPGKTLELVESGNLGAVSCVEGTVSLARPESKTRLRESHNGVALNLRQISAFEGSFALFLCPLKSAKGPALLTVQAVIFCLLRLV